MGIGDQGLGVTEACCKWFRAFKFRLSLAIKHLGILYFVLYPKEVGKYQLASHWLMFFLLRFGCL